MTLVLRIENFDQLENGGPTTLHLDGHGASVGRRAAMDWSLPDPTKMISGHHFDITFEGGAYYLTDVSMNGTFVDGQRHRLEGRLMLNGGERLIVGHYIIGVDLASAAAQSGAVTDPGGPAHDDPWGAPDPMSRPVQSPAGIAPVAGGRGAGVDAFNDGFISVPRPGGGGSGMRTETSLQLPMHTQGPGAVPPTAPGAAPAGGGIQTPTGWGVPLPPQAPAAETAPQDPPEEPFVAYVPHLGQEEDEATPGPLREAARPARQSTPPDPLRGEVPYAPSLGQQQDSAPTPAAPPVVPDPSPPEVPYTPNLGYEGSTPPYQAPHEPPDEAADTAERSPTYGAPEPGEPQYAAPPSPQVAPNAIPRPRPMPPGPPASAVPSPNAAPQAQPPRPAPAHEPMAQAPAAPPPGTPMGGDVGPALRAFCEGAGLDPKSLKPEDAVQVMHMLGRVARVATEEVMLMLKARADVKNFTRGGVRTMLSANANNPMKFMPDSQQALELMFVAPRDGFMTGADSFKDALGDIRQHQEAVFRALQPALADVFTGLSPEEIEASCESTGSNLLGKRSTGKQWQAYVDRWDQKAQAGEHGILDAFLQAFAKAYAEANTRE